MRKQGTELVTGGEERDKTLVDDLIVFKDQMDMIVDVAFQRRQQFQHTLKVRPALLRTDGGGHGRSDARPLYGHIWEIASRSRSCGLQESFESFVNIRQNKPAELVGTWPFPIPTAPIP